MVIQLSPTLEEQVERAAQAKGITPEILVADAVGRYLAGECESSERVSEARQQLRELLKHKKKVVDFDAAVHAAKREAGRLYEDNADWIERVAESGTEHGSG